MRDLILAIDGGQTSTKALLARVDGTIVGRGVGGPSDHFHAAGGVARNRAAIHGAIRSAYNAASLQPGTVRAVGLGLTGVHPGSPDIQIVEGLVRELVGARAITVTPDYVTNLSGASSRGWGVVVIAGGGAISYGVNRARTREALAGGFGYLIGDEGSAYYIGRRAVMSAVRADDGRDRATALEPLVQEYFGVAQLRDLPQVIYAADFSRDRMSHLAPLVISCAQIGDIVAQEIILDAANELARTALAVVRQIAGSGESPTIYVTGGVFQAGALILEPFTKAVHAGRPDANVSQPDFPPVAGALIEARWLCAPPPDDNWYERVRATLQESS